MARPDNICPAASGFLAGFLRVTPEPDPREPEEAQLDARLAAADDLMVRARLALDRISERTECVKPLDVTALEIAVARLETAVTALEAA